MILIGLLFGYGVRPENTRPLFKTRAYWCGKLVVCGLVALAYYSYLQAPDWMFMYFLPAATVPTWIVIYILILYFFAYDAGFFLKFELKKISPTLPPLALLTALVAEGTVILLLKDQYLHVGTLAEYQAGSAPLLAQTALSQVATVGGLALVAFGLVSLWWARRE